MSLNGISSRAFSFSGAASIVSYGFLFNMETLLGSVFVNTALYGFVGYLFNNVIGLLDYFTECVKRKTVHSLTLICILSMLLLIIAAGLENPNLHRISAITSAAMCSQVYIINSIVANELFPTEITSLAVGFLTISNRVGMVIAPLIFIAVGGKTSANLTRC